MLSGTHKQTMGNIQSARTADPNNSDAACTRRSGNGCNRVVVVSQVEILDFRF